MTTSTKIIYAQSSDIKSRTHLQYRRDMKKKAIAELEFLPFLRDILATRHKDPSLTVVKHGGDAKTWFSANGKITQEPDYLAEWKNNKSFLYEFQYAEKTEGLDYFDFKVSKVGKKIKGERIPHQEREFFYVVKPEEKYAFITPSWIMEHGQTAPVPAWGSRLAYRVPRNKFMPKLQKGGEEISSVIASVNDKNTLLFFQHEFLDIEAEKLSHRLQQVVDSKKLLSVVPQTLPGFYEVCYLLEKLDKAPNNPGVWLIYLLSFFNQNMKAMAMAQFMFSLDFLYFKCAAITDNEKTKLAAAIKQVQIFIRNYPVNEGLFAKNPKEPPFEETRQILFSINLLEDLMQDITVNLQVNVGTVEKIFQTVSHASESAKKIREISGASIV